MNEKEQPCKICGAPARCIGFSAYICKACSVFYRRNYKQFPTLKCKRDETCEIRHVSRNTCRFCRLVKCREVGGLRMVGKNLVVQVNGYPKDDVSEDEDDNDTWDEETTSTANGDLSREESLTVDQNEYPRLHKIIGIFHQYEQRQRHFSSFFQGHEIQDDKPVLISQTVNTQMKNINLRLLCLFVDEILAEFNLATNQKLRLMKIVSSQLLNAHQFLMTSRIYPKTYDTRVVLFIGFAYDVNNLQETLGEHYEAKLPMLKALFSDAHHVYSKVRRFQLTQIEGIMLMAIVLMEEIERQQIDACSDFRDNLYSEFHHYLSKQFASAEKASRRLMRLTSLLFEIRSMTIIREQMSLMLQVFLPEDSNTTFKMPVGLENRDLERLIENANEFVLKMSQISLV